MRTWRCPFLPSPHAPIAHCTASRQVMSQRHFLSCQPHLWTMQLPARRPVPGFHPSSRRQCLPHHEPSRHCFARHHVPQSSHSESSPDVMPPMCFMWPMCFMEVSSEDFEWCAAMAFHFHHRHLNASAGRAAPRATTKARHSARRAPRGAARRERARRVEEEEVEEESVMTRNGRFRMGVGTRVASFESRESDEAARRAWLLVLARSKGILGHRDHERSGASKEVRGGTSDETLDACPEKKRTFEAENEPRIVDVLARLGRATARPGPLETPNPRLEPRTPGSIRARVL